MSPRLVVALHHAAHSGLVTSCSVYIDFEKMPPDHTNGLFNATFLSSSIASSAALQTLAPRSLQAPAVRRAVEQAGLPHPGCCMSPPAAAPFEVNRQCFRLCHLAFFYCIICRAARRANRRPGQRFIANNSNPIPYNKLNRSLPRFTGLPITGSPAAAGLVSTPAGAGAVVPPFIELHFHPPCIFIAGQRQNANANATRPQRRPTYVVSSWRATNVAATVDSFLAQRRVCLSMQHLFSFDQASLFSFMLP